MNNEPLKGHLDLLLLQVLAAGGPAHGYQILAALTTRSGGTIDLPEGTVYPALHRLEQQGLLASGWDSSTGRRRRVYSLTGLGGEALQTRRGDWKRFSVGMARVLRATA